MTRRNTYTLLAAIFGALVLAAALLTSAGPAQATAKIKCKLTTGVAQVDPIINHDEPGPSSHLHQFFGNNGWLAKGNYANYSDLIGQGTNCDNAADTAGYWQPVVIDTRTGKHALTPQAFTAYYRTFDSKDTGSGNMAFPADTRLTAMVADAFGKSPGAAGWFCGQYESVPLQATIPDCSGMSQKPGHVLTVHISFPSCWNGVLPNHHDSDVGNTSDDANYAFPVRSGSKWVCPAAFPQHMVQLRETVQYPNPGKIPVQYLAVSSDPVMGGHNGSSMHGDFFNAWAQQGFEDAMCQQVNAGNNCVTPPSSEPSPTPTPTDSPSPTPTPTPTATSAHPWCDAHPGRCHGHRHH